MILEIALFAYPCFVRHFFYSKVFVNYATSNRVKMPSCVFNQVLIIFNLHERILAFVFRCPVNVQPFRVFLVPLPKLPQIIRSMRLSASCCKSRTPSNNLPFAYLYNRGILNIHKNSRIFHFSVSSQNYILGIICLFHLMY